MPKPMDIEALDRALKRINRAAETVKTVSAGETGYDVEEHKRKRQRFIEDSEESPYTSTGSRGAYHRYHAPAVGAYTAPKSKSPYALYAEQLAKEQEIRYNADQQAREMREERIRTMVNEHASQGRALADPENHRYAAQLGKRTVTQARDHEMQQMAFEKQYSGYLQERSRAFTERPPVNDWEGRRELLDEYRRLRRNYDPAAPVQAETERRRELLDALRAGDAAAGNGVRDYTFGDRAGSVLSGSTKNIWSELASTAGTMGETLGREQMLEQARNMDQTIWDIKHHDNDYHKQRVRETLDAAEQAGRTWQRITDAADRLGEDAARELDRAKNGLSRRGQLGVDIAQSTIEFGFDLAAGYLTAGAMDLGLASNAAARIARRTITSGSSALRKYGAAAQEARKRSAPPDEQALYGTAMAGKEIIEDKLFNALFKTCGSKAAESISKKIINRLAKTPTSAAMLSVLSKGGARAIKEFVDNIVDPLVKRIFLDTDIPPGSSGQSGQADYLSYMEDAELLYSGLAGFSVGLLDGCVSIAENLTR